MADPLSLAASIAGLISLADVTFKYTYKFVRAAKDAKNDVSTLADEINNLGSVLRVLEALASDMEAEGDQFDPTLRNHYLNHCFKTLSRIEMKTKKATERFVRSKVESIYQHLKWPFSASETRSLLDELSRHKETISMALAADSMQKLQLSLTKIDKLGENISKVEKIVKRVEINTLIEVNAQKQRILNYFMKADPQDNLATSIKLRHSMTGLWLTESTDFVRWIDTPGSKLWLTGIPGAGKTVLAGSVIQEVLSRSYSRNDIGVAFFFCDYKNPKTWETVNILGAIANQLARQRKEAFEILNLYYDDLHPPEHIGNNPDSDELRSKISQMSDLFHRTIIVIDGLDECGDNTDDVVDTLIQMIEDSENTSLAVFSRDHYNIRVNLEAEFEIIPIIAHTNDIQLYVGAELDRRVRTQRLQLATLHMKQEIQEVLVSRAEGMFRWVVCQLDYLCDCAHDDERREALSKLPPDLPESYRRLLERVNRCSPRVQDMVQKCLHFLTIDEPKLTIHELRQAVSAPERIGETLNESNTISEQEISRRCSSLIRKSTDGRHFEFAHFSVREFLENRNAVLSSPDLEKYWIDWDSTRALFSAQCLRFLQMANFDSIPIDFEEVFASNISDLYREITETYPFYRHATTWWLRHNDVGFDDSTVLALVKSLFSPSKRACFVLWSIEILHQVSVWNYASVDFHRQACKIVNRSSFRPLHMAAALNLPEICSFLLLEESDANRRAETANYIDLALVSVLAIPGMPDLCTERSKEAPRVRRVVDLFLPSTERRNETIDCLIAKGAHPSSHEISLNSASVFSIVCMLAATFNDLSPITKILSLNISPTLPEIKVLQEWIPKAGSYDDQAELSAKGLMQYLGQPKTHSTDWGREAASVVWSWTLNSGFSFKKDEYLNSGLDVPSEGLDMIQIHSAIRSDDLNIIKRWLNESHRKMERLDLANAHKILHFALYKKILECTDREKLVSSSAYQDLTLLHMLATDKDASSILWLAEELIHRGLEINLSRSGCQEDSAINHHIRNNSFQFAELLLQNGASPLIDGVLPFRIIETVIEAGNAEFLDRILAHAADMSAEVNWIDSNPIFAVNDTQEICVNRGNVLHLAVDPKSIVCLERLLKKWLAKREDLIQKNEFTPLHVAAFKKEAVELLLANGFDAMAENNLDQTPLHLAAQVGSVPVVKCLLSHGAFDSFDIFGRSAKTTALELGFTEIVETLEKTNNKEICSANQKRQKLRQRQKHLARGLERAVWAYDYGSMAMLLDSGCPIDVWLPTNQGGTALTWALELERPAVVRWLLERGASTLSAKHTNGVEDSVVEMASARAVFSYQLEEILQKYWLEGGNLITDEDFPFHDAVWNNNTSGIDILLEECGRHYGMEGPKKLGAILNRQSLSIFCDAKNWRSGTHYAFTTPLHIACWLGNKSVVSLLVDHGALVDASDGNGWTPLMYVRSADMACHLVELGASASAMCRFGSLPSMISWFGPGPFHEIYESLSVRLPKELLDEMSPKQLPTGCEDIPMSWDSLAKLRELRHDLLAQDHSGRSLMHCVVCEDDLFYFVLNYYPDLAKIGPFPWHMEWRPFSSLAFLTLSFGKYRRCVPFESFRHFLNLEPSRGWSPLCRAAALNIVTIVENCLSMGADIDYEGCPLGTAVMIAIVDSNAYDLEKELELGPNSQPEAVSESNTNSEHDEDQIRTILRPTSSASDHSFHQTFT
ncbi:hypothetical protein FPOAC1_006967 [Fusarium poae]|uniref:hypothetical protein n=1 Tax=Fusarium poae TaxID=36050 RepID=UPI001CE74A11|nr:hypothetical protein FPOAC1_006967 [Fusarium poae]KAG8673653.1 hypothetical protein FPOAC1_006967 [Fusarium poae]